ncbi:MAG TPA: hypothetical protein VLU38_05765, partial [Methanomassiliicoccales archaeon]|nr:hypothetical protein [Methanomassiliicoccales archaeon]
MAIIVIVMAILISALAGAFIQVTEAPILTQPIAPHKGTGVDPYLKQPQVVYQDPNELDLQKENLGDEALFVVSTSTNLAYLRTSAYDTYSQGIWSTESIYSDYNGTDIKLDPVSSNRTVQTAQIIPIGKLYGGLPVAKDTFRVQTSNL